MCALQLICNKTDNMKLDELHILHIYSYSKPEGEPCLLKRFVQKVNPLAVSTCMRHIYIFSSPQLEAHKTHFEELERQLTNPRKHQARSEYEHIRGEEAYAWLLYWVIGGYNKKKPFDDPRILGDLRATLRSYEISNKRAWSAAWFHNKEIAIALRMDGKHLVEWVKLLPQELSSEEKSGMLREACYRCTQLRTRGLLPFLTGFDYSSLSSETIMREAIEKQLDFMEKKSQQEHKKFLQRTSGETGFLFAQGMMHIENKLKRIAEIKREFLENKISEERENYLIVNRPY